MSPVVVMRTLLMMMVLSAVGCSSSPEAVNPYNDADSQRSRAQQAQDELSSETVKK